MYAGGPLCPFAALYRLFVTFLEPLLILGSTADLVELTESCYTRVVANTVYRLCRPEDSRTDIV